VGRWGYNYDSDTGLYLARSRWLDPATGTWLSTDPIDVLLGDPNRYRYALNNPIGLIDPSGEIAFLPILAFVGKSALAGTVSGGLNALIAWICGRDPWQAFKAGLLPRALGFVGGALATKLLGRVLPAWLPRWSRRGIEGSLGGASASVVTQFFTGNGEISLGLVLIDAGLGIWGSYSAGKPLDRKAAYRRMVKLLGEKQAFSRGYAALTPGYVLSPLRGYSSGPAFRIHDHGGSIHLAAP